MIKLDEKDLFVNCIFNLDSFWHLFFKPNILQK